VVTLAGISWAYHLRLEQATTPIHPNRSWRPSHRLSPGQGRRQADRPWPAAPHLRQRRPHRAVEGHQGGVRQVRQGQSDTER